MAGLAQFGEDSWAEIARDYTAWWKGELDRPLLYVWGVSEPVSRDSPAAPSFIPQIPRPVSPGAIVERYEADLGRARWYADGFPSWWPNYGAGVLSACLGSTLAADGNTVWFSCEEPSRAADLRLRLDPANPWWSELREVTRLAAERWRDRVCVGYADLGGNLDILAPFRTTQGLLTDLMDCPEEVERLSRSVTEAWLRCFEELHALSDATGRGHAPWAPIWSPGRCYMFQSDFSFMISPAMFERFVLPDLEACCRAIPDSFYHLDGKGELPHLDILLSLEGLRGIQWVPGEGPRPDPADWPDVLARIRGAGKLCQLFTSPEGARRVVREHGGKGFLLAIDRALSREEASALEADLRSEDRRRGR